MMTFLQFKGGFIRRYRVFAAAWPVVLLAGIVIIPMDVSAQATDNTGVAYVTGWPESRQPRQTGETPPALNYGDYKLLPFIDSLAVRYRFDSDGAAPSMHFSIEWKQGATGILNGRRVAARRMPDGIVIESVDLLMPVIVRDAVVAEYFLPLDTINLGPSPSMTFVDVSDVAWDSVFVDTDAADTRAILAAGFRLGEPRILRVVFAIERPDYRRSDAVDIPGPVPERTVCIPDIDIWVSWTEGRRRWVPPPGSVSKATRDRRGEIGRTGLVDRGRVDRGYVRPSDEEDTSVTSADSAAEPGEGETEATGDREGTRAGRDRRKNPAGGAGIGDLIKPKDDDDDDDDDDRFYPAAIAGAAAIGGIAIFGGTIGYFGSASKAPIGLMSGYVEPRGGFLLQVAINRQVFGRASGPENLVAGITSFYDAFRSPIQPALGLGVRLTEEGTDTAKAKPSIAVGLAANLGMVVALAAYDVTTPDFRFGIALNLRQMR